MRLHEITIYHNISPELLDDSDTSSATRKLEHKVIVCLDLTLARFLSHTLFHTSNPEH